MWGQGVAIVLRVFFCFSRGFCHFWSKPKKTSRKQKKQNSTDYVGPRGSHRAMVSRVFFCFLEVFATFGQKPKKPRENQKNQNSTEYVAPRGSHRAIVSRVLFFFCFFFRFLEFFGYFGVPFCFFGMFCFLEMVLEECYGVIGFIVFLRWFQMSAVT